MLDENRKGQACAKVALDALRGATLCGKTLDVRSLQDDDTGTTTAEDVPEKARPVRVGSQKRAIDPHSVNKKKCRRPETQTLHPRPRRSLCRTCCRREAD